VRALDDNSRGNARRLAEVANDIEFIAGDIRDPGAVDRAAQGLDEIHHLAYVNGSQFSTPSRILSSTLACAAWSM